MSARPPIAIAERRNARSATPGQPSGNSADNFRQTTFARIWSEPPDARSFERRLALVPRPRRKSRNLLLRDDAQVRILAVEDADPQSDPAGFPVGQTIHDESGLLSVVDECTNGLCRHLNPGMEPTVRVRDRVHGVLVDARRILAQLLPGVLRQRGVLHGSAAKGGDPL